MSRRRTYIAPGSRTFQRNMLSRFYGALEKKSRPIVVTTRCDGHNRYPFAESVLNHLSIQPRVHECRVTIFDRNRPHQYIVFYRVDPKLPLNRAAAAICREYPLQGDVVVMRLDRSGEHVVGMRQGDAVMSNTVVEELAWKVSQYMRREIDLLPEFLMTWTTHYTTKRQRAITGYGA